MDLIEGCYETVKDAAFVKYLGKIGFPKEEADKVKGTHWKCRLERTKDERWIMQMCCEECPDMNMFDSFKEGVEKEVDHPLFGGKAKVCMRRSGCNRFKNCSKSEKYGTFEWIDTFTEDGVEVCFTHKDSGATSKEFWTRKVKMLGWFEFVKEEGLEDYFRATKWPEPYDPRQTMHVGFAMNGDACVMTEVFGKHCIVTRMRVNHEVDYAPETPFQGKLHLSKVAPRHYKFTFKSRRGREEWDLKFCSKGCEYVGCHKESGAVCKVFFRPCVYIFGKYKPICISNFHKFGMAHGIPAEMCHRIAHDLSARVEFTDEGDGYVKFKYDSKYMPMEVCFKWGEEFVHCAEHHPDKPNYRVCVTRRGTQVCQVWKEEKLTTCMTIKFTDCYAIFCNKILGTNISCTYVYQRC